MTIIAKTDETPQQRTQLRIVAFPGLPARPPLAAHGPERWWVACVNTFWVPIAPVAVLTVHEAIKAVVAIEHAQYAGFLRHTEELRKAVYIQ